MRTRSKDYTLPEARTTPRRSTVIRKRRQEDKTSSSLLAGLPDPKPPVLLRKIKDPSSPKEHISSEAIPWPEGSGPRQLPHDAPASFRNHRGSGVVSPHSDLLTSNSSLRLSPSLAPAPSPDRHSLTADMASHRDAAPHTVPKWREPEFLFKIPGMMKTAAPTLSNTGDNYENWKYRVESLVEKLTKSLDFLNDPAARHRNQDGDNVVKMMIEHSVHDTIGKKIRACSSAYEMFHTVRSMFHHPSRSSQINIMKELLALNHTPGDDIGVYINKVDERFQELEASGFTWSVDSAKGIIYQLGLPAEYSGVVAALNRGYGLNHIYPSDPRRSRT